MKEACLNMLQEYLLTRTFGHISQIWAASPLAASYSAKHRSSQRWPGDVATRTKSQTKQKIMNVICQQLGTYNNPTVKLFWYLLCLKNSRQSTFNSLSSSTSKSHLPTSSSHFHMSHVCLDLYRTPP